MQKNFSVERQQLYTGQQTLDQRPDLTSSTYSQGGMKVSTVGIGDIKSAEVRMAAMQKSTFQGAMPGLNFTSPFNQSGYAREMSRSYVKKDVSQADI